LQCQALKRGPAKNHTKRKEDKKMLYTFNCYFIDNSGKKQNFTVKAKDKQQAIEKAFKKARKNANGDIVNWSVKLGF
jgi:hypothetical protein